MNEKLKLKTDKFLEYSKIMKKDFKGDYAIASQCWSLMHVIKDKQYDKDSIISIKNSIKKKTGILSQYRGSNLSLLANLMYVEFGYSEAKIEELLSNEKKLRDAGFKNSSYMPITAFSLLMSGSPSSTERRIEKAYSLFQEMKNNHPWITGGDDHPLCVLLSASDDSTSVLSQRIEDMYTALTQEGFKKGNSLQFLSHILSFSNSSCNVSAKRCMEISDALKENKLKISSTYYASLGLISLISENDPSIVDKLIELSTYLRDSKELKWADKGTCILFASALISADYIDSKEDLVSAALTISVETLIAAQIAATTAAIMAASTAAVAASTSS